METYYLLDFENVNSDGLAGCDQLTETDHIIIFFTRNAMKINMSDIANHGGSELRMIEIPAGKQSTDIHIGSYLGYLVGIHEDKECCIVIVSKDKDFDNVVQFWEARTNIKISRVPQIRESFARPAAVRQLDTSEKNVAKVDGTQKTKLNVDIMQTLSKAGFESEIVNCVASIVVKNVDAEKGKQQIYRSIISKYGQNKGLNIYNHIKKQV